LFDFSALVPVAVAVAAIFVIPPLLKLVPKRRAS
jgi:hypothetical protein